MRTASFSLLTILCLMLAVDPAMADTLYDNGPYNGTTDAWAIDYGSAVSDSFTVLFDSEITGFHMVYWTAAGNVLTSVDMAFGATSFGGFYNAYGVSNNTFLTTNQFGFALYQADLLFISYLPWSDRGYVSLQNACTIGGCSDGEFPIYWDENSGRSLAFENTLGSIPSEAFTLTGFVEMTPEPSSILLFGSGILGLAGVLRWRLNI